MAWFVMVWHGRRTLYEGWQLAYVVAFVAIRVRYGMAVVACGWWTMHRRRRVVRRDDVCAPVRGAGGAADRRAAEMTGVGGGLVGGQGVGWRRVQGFDPEFGSFQLLRKQQTT
jgi:hypothetical protein